MSITAQDIEQFRDFAQAKLASGEPDLTWQQLFQDWLLEHPSDEERDEVNAIIRQGIADIDAGNSRPADEVHSELRTKFKFA